jgi:hypothetical protein
MDGAPWLSRPLHRRQRRARLLVDPASWIGLFFSMPSVDNGTRYRASIHDWHIVRSYTLELGHIEKLATAIAQWDKTVRFFRQVEQSRFYEDEPTDFDRENHRTVLHLLIGLGQNWLLETKDFNEQQWAGYGFTRADLAAYVADLEDTFFMFYTPDSEPGKLAGLQRTIFGGKA